VTTGKYLATDCCHNGKALTSLSKTTSVYAPVPTSSSSGKVQLQDLKSRRFVVAKSFYGHSSFYEVSAKKNADTALKVQFVRTAVQSVIVSACVVRWTMR